MATLALPEVQDTGANDGEIGEVQQSAPDVESEATLLGWKPEAEYTGRGEWVPADVFMDRQKQHLGLANKRVEQLSIQVRKLETSLKRVMRSEQNAHSNALAQIKDQMRRAVETGDMKAFEALDIKAEDLRQNMADDTPGDMDPSEPMENWRTDNAWYDKAALASAREDEVEARLFADRRLRQMAKAAQSLTGADLYKQAEADFATLEAEIAEKFPALKTKAPRQKPASDVAGVTRTTGPRGARTGANLPADAKATAERYIRMKIPGYTGKTKAEAYEVFAKDWDWS